MQSPDKVRREDASVRTHHSPNWTISRPCMAQIPLALWVMWTPELAANRLAGKTASSRLMLTISAGYFLYDAAVSILRYEGIAYLLHGVVSCALYTYGALTGWLGYYGASAWPLVTPLVRLCSTRAPHLHGQRQPNSPQCPMKSMYGLHAGTGGVLPHVQASLA